MESKSLYSSSMEMKDEDDARVEKLQHTIRRLMAICAQNEVDLPEDLTQALLESLGEENEPGRMGVSLESHTEYLSLLASDNNKGMPQLEQRVKAMFEALQAKLPDVEVRVKDGSYTVVKSLSKLPTVVDEEDGSPRRAKQKIQTVVSENPCYGIYRLIKSCIRNKGHNRPYKQEKVIMEGVDLVFETGKMYLVLGSPGSGKSTLLKYIADCLYSDKTHFTKGDLSVAGISPGKKIYWTKLVAYIDQIDRLHAYLTVKETLNFAWKCRSGGTHAKPFFPEGDDTTEMVAEMDKDFFLINKVLDIMGLARVQDTFVGDQQNVRGVSGGEKKRVTCAEMFCSGVPVLCCDEISTGLDAATTYDITRVLASITRLTKTIKIVSLLQPPPETVANFDEVILLSQGKVIFFGPIDRVEGYFTGLGYEIPERMDLADWLQALPTKEGWKYLAGANDENANHSELSKRHLTSDGFHEKFYNSSIGNAIRQKLDSPYKMREDDKWLLTQVARRYVNPWYTSCLLLLRRELTLWWRDKYQIKAKIMQTLIMGIVVGTVFYQGASKASNVFSLAFQSMFYVTISAMVLIIKQFPARSIFYKHQDANFFPTWTYVVGRSLSTLPVALIDAVGYGTMIYFLTGLAYNDGASIGNYFVFMLLLFVTSFTAGLFFSILSSCVKVVTSAQACMAVLAIIIVLFSGFTVQPDVIPPYYIWIYWINYAAWILRALVVNEFDSGKYNGPSGEEGITQGEAILMQYGFSLNGEPFTYVWAWWGFLFCVGFALVSMWLSILCLNKIRYATGGSLVTDQGNDEIEEPDAGDMVTIPFKRVDLTFRDVHYSVHASTSKEKLELLKGIDGVVRSGKMTALMGSSGAGKTTLMDVIALRKTSGEIMGDVRVNGHPQEPASFRRCTGYVEQFDTQSPQLTIHETVKFSAKLRLDENDPAVTPETINKFVAEMLYMLELTNIQDLQVGSDETGGLSFEQRKRLSIAVELVANPSILFLDEPTSGLDARAASIVMRGMRRIANCGRAVCATIHQPSVAIFEDFDSLLLLKRGGEVVFHGDLGKDSVNLISYLERFEATPKIKVGENPATWMLTTTGAGSASPNKPPFDYVGSYFGSKLRSQNLSTIEHINSLATEENKVVFESVYATSRKAQFLAVMKRAFRVYYRSPAYNVVRTLVCGFVALLFSSVYASQRVPMNEGDMNSRINSIFMAVLFLCVSSQNTVLSVFERERNMYYRHKAANMYRSGSILVAYTIAELPFIVISSLTFSVLFYFIMGFSKDAAQFFLFYAFVLLALMAFTFSGQMFISLLRDATTAQGIGSLFITLTSLFSGVFLRPADIPVFWIFLYWALPGHYIFEGLFMSQFAEDNSLILASSGSPFYQSLGCTGSPCYGPISQWMAVNFVGFTIGNVPIDAMYLVLFILLTRLVAFLALTRLDYRAT